MCERDQHVLQDTYCGFTVEKIFKHISCWKTKDIYDICVCTKFRELNPTSFLGWYGILNAIPKEWKMSVKNCGMCERDQHVLQDTYCGFTVEKIFKHISCWKTKDIYDICVCTKFSSTSKEFFTLKFNVANEDWKRNYTLAEKVTIDTRMRIFQYKILNNILYLNRQLFRMKLVDSPFCSLRGHCVKTVTHLFLSCTVSQELWDEIIEWSRSCMLLPKLTEQIIYLGWFQDSSYNILINHIILLFKQFIYIRKESKSQINIQGFKHFLKNIIDVKKVIVNKRKKLDDHF